LRNLPGWLDEGSVRVGLQPADAAHILDVEVRKTFLARPSDEEVRKAEAAVREFADQVASLEDERGVLEAQARHVDSIRAFSLDKLPKDMAVREVKMAEYGQVVDFIGEALRKIAKARRELDVKQRELQPELAARQRKLDELRQRAQLEQRTIIVTLKAPAAVKATLQVAYLLPGAAWEPVHELRASPDGKSVKLYSFAVIRQTTGEDWTDAAVALSTQNTGATMHLPELQALTVGSGKSLARVVGLKQESFEQAKGNFKSQFHLYNKFANPQDQQMLVLDNEAATVQLGELMLSVFQKLQQRGTTAHFAAAATQIIRTDGNPVRVQIGAVELAGQQRILAAPEASLNAARTLDLVNTGNQPLLPGKVSLFLEGSFLGTTETEFVAQGEPFAMFLGVVDRVKLSRTLDARHSSHFSDGKRTRLQVTYLATVENLSDREIALQFTDRVPVSESEEVRVRNVRVLPDCRPDEKGLLKWDVVLGGKQTREFRIEYTLEYPSDLPNRAVQPAQQDAGQKNMQQELQQLEQQLKK
jgi:uncharacterized protein (TIGR02231 family)